MTTFPKFKPDFYGLSHSLGSGLVNCELLFCSPLLSIVPLETDHSTTHNHGGRFDTIAGINAASISRPMPTATGVQAIQEVLPLRTILFQCCLELMLLSWPTKGYLKFQLSRFHRRTHENCCWMFIVLQAPGFKSVVSFPVKAKLQQFDKIR